MLKKILSTKGKLRGALAVILEGIPQITIIIQKISGRKRIINKRKYNNQRSYIQQIHSGSTRFYRG